MTAVEHGINFLWNLQALFKQQIKDAYNQGYREGLEHAKFRECIPINDVKDVAECSYSENYYNETFNK
jgi:hypothetical protein